MENDEFVYKDLLDELQLQVLYSTNSIDNEPGITVQNQEQYTTVCGAIPDYEVVNPKVCDSKERLIEIIEKPDGIARHIIKNVCDKNGELIEKIKIQLNLRSDIIEATKVVYDQGVGSLTQKGIYNLKGKLTKATEKIFGSKGEIVESSKKNFIYDQEDKIRSSFGNLYNQEGKVIEETETLYDSREKIMAIKKTETLYDSREKVTKGKRGLFNPKGKKTDSLREIYNQEGKVTEETETLYDQEGKVIDETKTLYDSREKVTEKI